MDRFVLIDGNAIMHRAYHALPPLSKNGRVVNAVYGFFSMFLKILQDVKPSFIAVCFDMAAPTFRKQLFVGYQAHRPKMEDDLGEQFKLVHEILKKIGVQIFEIEGYEADDLIGTLARQATEINTNTTNKYQSQISNNEKIEAFEIGNLKLEIIIVTGDRDMLQLVNERVKVLAPIVGITNMTLFDEAKVEEKYGLKPSQFIDYKALVGDASDGYQGVTGIGPKTASTLLQKYETFENLYQHVSELTERVANALATDAEQAALAKKLATIVTDAPISFEVEKCNMKYFDREVLGKEFERMEFKSLLKRLEEGESETKEKPKKQGNVSKQLGLL